MPPKKAAATSPYFQQRKSTRVSNASTKTSSKKRPTLSSESEFDDSDSPDSDFHAKSKVAKGNKQKRAKKDDSSEADIDEEDSDDETKPPKTIIIPLPKAREAGDTPYEDETIHENTMLFLKDLKANNNRNWMRFNDEDFRTSQKDFASFIEQLTPRLTEKDFTIPELPTKDLIFRIYRDVRFSQDQTPYKPHFSAAWSRTGKKGPYAAYYLHVQPGHSLIGGGLWHPEASALEKLRADIDENPHGLRRALMSGGLRKDILKGKKDEKAVLNAFLELNSENALKTKPRGYEADHVDIKLLRLRNFTIGRKLDDSEITGADSLENIANLMGAMVPFITYLNSVVMPDPAPADSSEDDDDEEATNAV